MCIRDRSPTPPLQELGLYGNCVRDHGAAAFGDALDANHRLLALYLGGNWIGDAGAAALAAGLSRNRGLTSINLRSNFIGDQGASQLAMALQKNAQLTAVDLAENKFGDAAGSAFAAALKVNYTLTALDLRDNTLTAATGDVMTAALEQNFSMVCLQLSTDAAQPGERGGGAPPEVAAVLKRNAVFAETAQEEWQERLEWMLSEEQRKKRREALTLYNFVSVSYTHLRAHETVLDLVCRLLLEKKKTKKK
eukprot:TRINITY_DN12332_c0_g1_i2.p1 TRINITY_DN12332_c0_g1~~TRINITY_DN12332_c0_g1_i2.p1  ORF type:complete len:250 (-),score=45.40 TRINITY_DN12332_c0_g1_i2:33-782(-)